MYRALLLPLLMLALTACDREQAVESQHRIKAGEPFPEVVLPGLDRDDLSLSQLRGKVVVLNVWATWCPPCRRELPSLQRLGELLDRERFRVVGLSVDDNRHEPREYLIDRKIKLESYIDLDMSIANRLGVVVFPDTFLIGRDGRLLMSVEGEREWDSPQVIAALEAAFAGDAAALQGVLHQDVRE